MSLQPSFSGDRWRISILFDFLYYFFFFSEGSVFNTTQICCCCPENSRSSGILWKKNYFLRDQYTCLHTDHFIQFNSTIKRKHLWRTFLAFKITLIFIEVPCRSLCRGLCLWWLKNKLSAHCLLPEHLAVNFPLTHFDDL